MLGDRDKIRQFYVSTFLMLMGILKVVSNTSKSATYLIHKKPYITLLSNLFIQCQL